MPINNRRRFLKISSAAALCTSIDLLAAQTMQLIETDRMPALFIGHGSPMNAILQNEYTATWRKIGREFPKPRLILSISAHWQSRGASYLTANSAPPVIYDMSGFPKELYAVKYPARGAPEILSDIHDVVDQPILETQKWGLDHGTWLVLKHMYPDADVPVVQLSINANLSPQEHFNFAKQLSQLRQKGVLIMGSGNLVHNLPRRNIAGQPAFDWAEEFDQIMVERVEAGDFGAVCDYQELGGLARLAHPTSEHFIPLLYTLGTMSDQDNIRWFNTGFYKSSISMRSLSLV